MGSVGAVGGSVEAFDIRLASPVYFAGQDLSGSLLLALSDDTKISEILLELKGAAKSYWTKHSGTSRRHWADSEPYLSQQLNTGFTHSFGEPSNRVLPKGQHVVPFTLQLPKTLPSSFEGEFGHVRYTVRAILERPWDFDIVSKTAFSVVGIEDMNSDTQSREPVRLEKSDFEVRWCCQRHGTISLTLSLPKSGYAPGEALALTATIRNESSKTLRYAVARIKQHTTYRAKTFAGLEKSKEVTKVIVSKEKGAIPPHSSQQWSEDRLPIPPVPPKLIRCRIIDISYSLEFEVDPGIVVMSPLIIGTIPLVDSEAATPRKVVAEEASPLLDAGKASPELRLIDADGRPAAIPEEDEGDELRAKRRVRLPSSILSELYPSLPPPTFEPSLFGPALIHEEKETQHFGPKDFTPHYALFKAPPEPTPPPSARKP